MVKLSAKIISFVFHPLLVGVYMAIFLALIHPYYYHYLPPAFRVKNVLTFFNNNFVFPVLVVLLMRGLGFIKSIQLNTQKERIVPLMASIIFFFWTWNVFYHFPEIPQVMKDMAQGIFYASIAAMIANIYFKISLHAVGVGGLMGLMLVVLQDGQMYSGFPMAISVMVTGLVLTARLLITDHQPGDLMAGFLVGFLGQLVAAWVI
jgi:hypothetical protein